MIQFEKFSLENGLRVLVHEDKSTPMVVVNVLYDVGARDENPEKTGFAHFFEHLMFGGSKNIPVYDEPLQVAGGENNAYTTNDLTNYYCQLPAENIETAFWLESDRMLSLAFGKKSLEVQRKVVSEEFKEHYINKPYGDVWHKLRELVYTTHPYKWMTIGASLKHIEDVKLQDVKDFFFKHYTPSNAVLVVAGNVNVETVKTLSEKWFGSIPAGVKYDRNLPKEPKQTAPRFLEIKANVPLDALYKVWHIYPRTDPRYYTADLITDILSGGGSSRLFQSLVKEKKLFSSIDCYHLGSTDSGIITIDGKLVKGIDIKVADAAVMEELKKLQKDGITTAELEKVKNKTESAMAFEDMSVMSRAQSIAMYELLGDADLINSELSKYQSVTAEQILEESRIIFDENNCSTMYYLSNNSDS
ncbi:MAG: pitrilysin family protein [Ferruginibacter sp.]